MYENNNQSENSENENNSVDQAELEKNLKQALENLPFEALLKAKQKNIQDFNSIKNPSKIEKEKKEKLPYKGKRAKKDRPLERSSKIRVFQKNKIFEEKKKNFRDPRFEESSGTFTESKFLTSYSFLKDLKQKEIDEAEKILRSKRKRKVLSKEDKADLKTYKGSRKNEINIIERKIKESETKKDLKKEIRERGIQNPYISKKQLQKRFNEKYGTRRNKRVEDIHKRRMEKLQDTKLNKMLSRKNKITKL